MAIYTIAFLSSLSVSCIVVMVKNPDLELSTIVTTSVAGILTIATMYIGVDSMRRSE